MQTKFLMKTKAWRIKKLKMKKKNYEYEYPNAHIKESEKKVESNHQNLTRDKNTNKSRKTVEKVTKHKNIR